MKDSETFTEAQNRAIELLIEEKLKTQKIAEQLDRINNKLKDILIGIA